MADQANPPEPTDEVKPDFAERLERARSKHGLAPEKEAGAPARNSAMATGFRVGLELVVGVAFGSFVGWLLDGWLGTRPWLMILFFFFGAGAGVLNVMRASMLDRRQDEKSFEKSSETGRDGSRRRP